MLVWDKRAAQGELRLSRRGGAGRRRAAKPRSSSTSATALSDNPKGPRAYRIAITPDGEATTLLFENLKLPEPMAKSMEADARRWGAGAFGCADMEAGGWSENKPDAARALQGWPKEEPSPKKD